MEIAQQHDIAVDLSMGERFPSAAGITANLVPVKILETETLSRYRVFTSGATCACSSGGWTIFAQWLVESYEAGVPVTKSIVCARCVKPSRLKVGEMNPVSPDVTALTSRTVQWCQRGDGFFDGRHCKVR